MARTCPRTARTPWARFVDQASGSTNPFRERLAPHSVVFWPGPHGKAWLVLGHATWFSADQGAGIVFHRQTAIDFADRKLASSELVSAIANCAGVAARNCSIDVHPARAMCARNDGPDYLILNARIEGHAAVEWPLPPEIGPAGQALFLYTCSELAENEKGRR